MKIMISLAILIISISNKSLAVMSFPNEINVNIVTKKNLAAKPEIYKLQAAAKPWKICVSLPNPLDQFWWSVSYGLKIAEEHLKVDLVILDAGGYSFINVQKKQLRECLQKKADAVIVSAISPKDLEDEIKAFKKQNIPVVDLVNGFDSDGVSAHSLVPFKDLVNFTAKYLNKDTKVPEKRKLRLAWFPGPRNVPWSIEMDKAFLESIDPSKFEIMQGGFAETESCKQRSLLEGIRLEKTPDIYVGNAVLSALVARMNKASVQKSENRVFSSYFTKEIEEFIQDGSIEAAPSNFPIYQAILAVDLAIRILEKRQYPYGVGPQIKMITRHNLNDLKNEFLTHPPNFRHYLKNSFKY